MRVKDIWGQSKGQSKNLALVFTLTPNITKGSQEYEATRRALDALSDAMHDVVDYIAEECGYEPEDDACDPPEGTICSGFHTGGTPHKTKDIDGNSLGKMSEHVHTWKMNKGPAGCYWNKRSKETYNYTPLEAKPCQSYPSWLLQEGR